MAEGSEPSKFETLRSWAGSQSRAFEELSYQLLKDEVPAGTRAIRTGTPDGGVEWYARIGDGTSFGWQAKHVHGIDALLSAMTVSVSRVALERPDVRKLTFVISWNLGTGTQGGEKISQRQKYQNKISIWKETIDGANDIDFDLIQESDLLDKLAQPEHMGRAWFWWAQPSFSNDWLTSRYHEQAEAAGEKYRPDLQVDLPIERDLQALGFDELLLSEFEHHRRSVVEAARELRLTASRHRNLAAKYKAITTASEALLDLLAEAALTAGSVSEIATPVVSAADECLSAISEAEDIEYQLKSEWSELPSETPNKDQLKPPEEARAYRVRRLRDRASELLSWLNSSSGKALQKPLYFLSGPAGSGKTHLLLDAVNRALGAGRPAVFLTGAHFGRGDLWASICDQLGLPPLGADKLLGAMNSAGEASGLRGRRFVIFVDALNETVGSDFWRTHLPTLRAAVKQWPHLALAVSCRDTYVDIVDDGNEQANYVCRSHPGFAGREVEATHRYFDHYRLEAPRIPLLTPEFTLPLFLRLYCESLRDSGEAAAGDGHEGRVRIFERYLKGKIKNVARRLRPQASTSFELMQAKRAVNTAVDAILDELVDTGQESMTVARAEEILAGTLQGDEVAVVLGHLQSEGVLTQELLYLDEQRQEGVRIVFQAFSDYLILKRRIAQASKPLADDEALKNWLFTDASWGILEAAAVMLPEIEGLELPDFLGLSKRDLVRPDLQDKARRKRHARARHIYESVVDTLPYRDSSAVTQRTIDHLNDALRTILQRDKFFQVLFTLAPQPENRLNAEGLHKYLLRFKMPARDEWFGFATYHEIWEEANPVARLARWADGGPYPTYGSNVIELASIPLIWLFSSPNRFMRDWVTKALVQLLRGHLDVTKSLIDRFWDVDDPYVVQRVIVVAYGALLRSDPQDRDAAQMVVEAVHRLVFTRPMRPDELMLDAARGVVEWGVGNGLLPDTALEDLRRPYGFKIPGAPPKEERIEARYGFQKDQPDEESYSSIRMSLLSMGDFGHYVVEPGVDHFSRYLYGQEFPATERSEPRLIKSKWRAFEKSLSQDQREQLELLTNVPDPSLRFNRWMPGNANLDLSEEQWNLLEVSWKYPERKHRLDTYPSDRARRWVFMRTLSLGWTPQVFGKEDRHIGHGRSREEHKAERWGKKYQWMAYHELLARVADNYQPSRSSSDEQRYEGLYQIIGDREIDPTLPPIGYRDLIERNGHGSPTWGPTPVKFPTWPPGRISFAQYRGSIDAFLADAESEPALDDVLIVEDTQGNKWILLDAYIEQSDPATTERWEGLRQVFALDTWLVPTNEARSLLKALPDLRKRDRHDLIHTQGHADCCYVGEIGWVNRACYYRYGDLELHGPEGNPWHLAPTTETYMWEGSLLDCSIGETVHASLPSTFIQQRADLQFHPTGPSWTDPSGEVVLVNREKADEDYDGALLVRADWLKEFLSKNELELVASAWYERRFLDRAHRGSHASRNAYAAARLSSSLGINTVAPLVEDHRSH